MNQIFHVETWIRIIVLLLGLGGGPRLTQKMVADELGLSKPTVSQHVRNMINKGYILKTGTNSRDILYAKGKTYHLVEPEIEAYLAMVKQNDGGMSGGVGFTPTYSIHLSGKGMTFDVIEEGIMEKLTIDKRGYCTPFLNPSTHTSYNGSDWWRTIVLYNGYRFQVGYQRTSKYKILSIHVKSDVLVSSHIAEDTDSCIEKLLSVVTPLLMAMERDGWKIAKDPTGNYKLRKPISDRDIHRALRETPNKTITDETGPFGISGQGIWCDHSKNELELETNEAAYIDAMVDLPKTKAMAKYAFSLGDDIKTIRQSCFESNQTLEMFVEMMNMVAESQTEIGRGFEMIVKVLTTLITKQDLTDGAGLSPEMYGTPELKDGTPSSFPLYI